MVQLVHAVPSLGSLVNQVNNILHRSTCHMFGLFYFIHFCWAICFTWHLIIIEYDWLKWTLRSWFLVLISTIISTSREIILPSMIYGDQLHNLLMTQRPLYEVFQFFFLWHFLIVMRLWTCHMWSQVNFILYSVPIWCICRVLPMVLEWSFDMCLRFPFICIRWFISLMWDSRCFKIFSHEGINNWF